jgi:Mg-chelatase subunit ChlD
MGDLEHNPSKEDDLTKIELPQEAVEELSGKPGSDPDEARLMHSVMENDEQAIEDGKLLAEAMSQGIGSFTPDLTFQNLVQEYRQAEKLYGKTIIRALTEYTPDFVRKNINIPEFQRTLQQKIEKNVQALEERGLIDDQGFITSKGNLLAALVLYTEELDALVAKGLGKEDLKEKDFYGEKEDAIPFKKGFRFRDIAMKRSIKTAIRRGHSKLQVKDLHAYERTRKGKIEVIYALDSSGSMRGNKLRMAKRAGIALAFKAIEEQNQVGLVIFAAEVEQAIPPTRDFRMLLMELTQVKAGRETDMAKTIHAAVDLFSKEDCTKHLVLLTDAVPTTGSDPRTLTLEATSAAHDAGVTVSIIGINLDEEGEELARDIVQHSEGRLYSVKDIQELDTIILQDYDALRGPA